jgi:hypothetical protein
MTSFFIITTAMSTIGWVATVCYFYYFKNYERIRQNSDLYSQGLKQGERWGQALNKSYIVNNTLESVISDICRVREEALNQELDYNELDNIRSEIYQDQQNIYNGLI